MATLTTVDGIQITFTAKAVSVIFDHDPSTGEALTCVYGITRGYLKVGEPVKELMSRLKIANNFAKFTRPLGSPVWIRGSDVSSIRAPVPDEFIKGVDTVVFTDSLTLGVRETPDDVKKAVNDHGGDL